MKTSPVSQRTIKKQVFKLLATGSPRIEDLMMLGPARRIINPLFGLLYNGDQAVKWRAVEAMGMVTDRLAREDIESARVIMRRLMWNLNDESGGIGWGSPEAMGEITARNLQLAKEFGCLLISYINPSGNFLEHPLLQRGSLWALGRLLNQRPEFAAETAVFLPYFLESDDPYLRALAAWAALPLKNSTLRKQLSALTSDHRQVELFLDGNLEMVCVSRLAGQALEASFQYQ